MTERKCDDRMRPHKKHTKNKSFVKNQQGRKSTLFHTDRGHVLVKWGGGEIERNPVKRYGIFARTERKSASVNNRELS